METKTKIIQFTKEKETRNTVKFTETPAPNEAPVVGTLYVQKWFAGDATKIKLTVEAT